MNPDTTNEVANGPWECFSDPCYYDMARLRRKDGPKDFNTGFHLNNLREAKELRDILNEYEARLAPAPEEPTIKESLTVEPEWRELGPNEVIQEGDECIPKSTGWVKAGKSIGSSAGIWCDLRFRTRRPLPKQEEMPLEQYIDMIDTPCDWSDIEARHVTATCIRYLRDEIQKLKEATPHANR